VRIELITRQGCHLCAEAEQLLLAARVQFQSLDIDADEALLRIYDFRVPVVLVEGRVVAEGRITAATLRQAITGV
jgi:glutaredoxin